ncbi:MAG TPA: hypothetical protein VHR35_03845 [Nocardioides sp.]|jgi:hypothetical protein|nr:hypothetical protein [Nocardioides sp.]
MTTACCTSATARRGEALRERRKTGIARPTRGVATLTLLALTLVAPLAGCGSSSSSSPASPGGGPAGGSGGLALSTRDVQRIEQCLRAAGLGSSFPTSLPTALPTGGLTGSPKGYPSTGPDGLGDPQVRAALKACGITLPTRSPGYANPG